MPSEEVEVQLPEGVVLSESDKNSLRELLAEGLADVTKLQVVGTQAAINAALDLGIVPTTSLKDGILTAHFVLPTLTITAFDPKAGRVMCKVTPAEGAVIKRSVVTGVLHVYGAESLGASMTEVEALDIDLTHYLQDTTKGEVSVKISLGSKTFVKVVAGRTTSEEMN
jgi:hypothetical protein